MNLLLQQNDVQSLSSESISSLLQVLRIAAIDLGRLSSEERSALHQLESQLQAEQDSRRWAR